MVKDRIEGQIYVAIRFKLIKYIFRANSNGGYNGYVKIKDNSKSISLTNSSSFNFNDDERFNITLADEKDRQYFEACFKHNKVIPDYINFKIKEQYEIY